jgi:hypothetical protein
MADNPHTVRAWTGAFTVDTAAAPSAGDLPAAALPRTFDEAAKARAEALQAAIQKEWERWGRSSPATDRIIISSWAPSIETGDRQEIEAVAICLLQQALQPDNRRPASPASLRHLGARALGRCLEGGFTAPTALLKVAKFLLEPKSPRHRLARPEERQRVIAFVAEHPEASRRAISKATDVSDSTIRKWLEDAHFVDQVNERAGKVVLSLKSSPRPGTQKR